MSIQTVCTCKYKPEWCHCFDESFTPVRIEISNFRYTPYYTKKYQLTNDIIETVIKYGCSGTCKKHRMMCMFKPEHDWVVLEDLKAAFKVVKEKAKKPSLTIQTALVNHSDSKLRTEYMEYMTYMEWEHPDPEFDAKQKKTEQSEYIDLINHIKKAQDDRLAKHPGILDRYANGTLEVHEYDVMRFMLISDGASLIKRSMATHQPASYSEVTTYINDDDTGWNAHEYKRLMSALGFATPNVDDSKYKTHEESLLAGKYVWLYWDKHIHPTDEHLKIIKRHRIWAFRYTMCHMICTRKMTFPISGLTTDKGKNIDCWIPGKGHYVLWINGKPTKPVCKSWFESYSDLGHSVPTGPHNVNWKMFDDCVSRGPDGFMSENDLYRWENYGAKER